MSLVYAAGAVLWLGIQTSLSPCPLSTNIAAMSYIARRVDRPALVFGAGLCYTLGRMTAYVLLGVIVVTGLLKMPQLSFALQHYLHRLLGPVLVLTAVFLLELVPLRFTGSAPPAWLQRRADRGGLFAAALLGFVFALALCPVSAALFFGGLVPLALQHRSGVLLPLVYGLGTAVPVLLGAVLLGLGTHYVARAFAWVQQAERWFRWLTGLVFLVVGLYMTFAYSLTL